MPIPCQIDWYIQILWDTFVHPETSCGHRACFPSPSVRILARRRTFLSTNSSTSVYKISEALFTVMHVILSEIFLYYDPTLRWLPLSPEIPSLGTCQYNGRPPRRRRSIKSEAAARSKILSSRRLRRRCPQDSSPLLPHARKGTSSAKS